MHLLQSVSNICTYTVKNQKFRMNFFKVSQKPYKLSNDVAKSPEKKTSEAKSYTGEENSLNAEATENAKAIFRSTSKTSSKPSWESDNVESGTGSGEKVKRLVEVFEQKMPSKDTVEKNRNNLFRKINPCKSIGEEATPMDDEDSSCISSHVLINNEILADSMITEIYHSDDHDDIANASELRQHNLYETLERSKMNDGNEGAVYSSKHPPGHKESILKREVKSSTFRRRNEDVGLSDFIKKPCLVSDNSNVALKGALYKLVNDKFEVRWCFLRSDFFLLYLDEGYKSVDKDFILTLDSVLNVQVVENVNSSFKVGDSRLFYFGIVTATNKYVFGSTNKDIRNSWLQKIAESLNCKLIADLYEYEKIGWSYIREGIKSEWFGAWFLLSNRTLYYSIDNVISTLDLRKIRAIKLQEMADDDILPHVMEEAPYLLLDYQKVHYSLRCWTFNDTESWYRRIQQANKNGSRLDEQQLNSYDVPVIVEKCVNFLFLNGSMSQGIYRHNGQSSSVTEILNQFKNDAWSVHLTPDKHKEHDVATALKRFFRDLPEPLIPKKEQHALMQIPYLDDEAERVLMYQQAFSSYPTVHYSTIKVILGHLQFIVSHSDKNQMTISNIASIWGITIMNTIAESNESLVAEDHMLHILIADLINLYKRIFPENLKEIQQKEAMKHVLDQFSFQPNLNSVKHAGDFLIWIHVESKRGESFSVTLNPQKTAYQVCSELSSRVRLPVHQLVLEEVVLNDSLIRPIHYSERVLDIVLKWNDWDEADKKNNGLIVSPIDKYNVYIFGFIVPVEGETKFADSEMKKFKAFTFNIFDGGLHCYKDVMRKQLLFSWKIKDIVWYLGCNETKRNPPTKHTITFISKYSQPTRTKANPYIGNVLAFPDEATKILWVSVLMKAAYSQGFLPPPQPTNIL